MRWVANLVYFVGGLVYLPILLYQMLVQGKNRSGWGERFGYWDISPSDKPRIWIHAVSLGEINATPMLVEQLSQALPGYEVIFSTTTDTGYARACQLYGPGRVFRYPLDFGFVVSRVLRRVRPCLIVLVELEIWYNLLRTAEEQGVPVAIINGRLSERSQRRFGLAKPVIKPMFARISWVGAQDEAIAERFVVLGTPADRVEVTGSVKWDTATVADRIDGADELAKSMGIDSGIPLWVCGSTGPGEESLLLDVYDKLLDDGAEIQLALVPRKPERFDEVASLIQGRGYDCLRRSQRTDGNPPTASGGSKRVLLGDTMGELRKLYSLADVVFVGRSLVPMGGSDPMEVAALAKPILVGPHTDNFAAPVAAFAQENAIQVVSTPADLAEAISCLLSNPDKAQAMANNARQVVQKNQGATEKTAKKLAALANTR